MKKIAIIPARAGSKGLANKNILNFCGKPLIAHTIEQAIESQCFDEIICTSDSDKILSFAKNYNITPLERPAKLASDESSAKDYLLHVLAKYSADIFILLQPTSPLRRVFDIKESLNIFLKKPDYSLISVSRATHYFSTVKEINGFIYPYFSDEAIPARRQAAPQNCYIINGSIYIWNTKNYMENPKTFYPGSIIYEMPKEISVDIDDIWDFKYAEEVYKTFFQEKENL